MGSNNHRERVLAALGRFYDRVRAGKVELDPKAKYRRRTFHEPVAQLDLPPVLEKPVGGSDE